MSSATSIESAPPGARDTQPARDTFKPWHFFVLASLIAATAAVVLARQSRPEHLILISLTIAAAGFAAGALYRTLAPLAGPVRRETVEPLTASMRANLEREKQLALRAIKELEFDRAMRKIAASDFDEMTGRLRARAIALMKQLDAEGAYRELIERELAARLASNARARKKARSRTDKPEGPRPENLARAACTCGTVNDLDAAFCKRCGTKLGGAES